MGVRFRPKFCSFYAPLIRALAHVSGSVLDLGAGVHSTFLLHWLCLDEGRELWTYEHDPAFYDLVRECESPTHHIVLVDDWDDADIERPWGVALVDHGPAIRRKEEIRRLTDWAQVILYHDSQGRAEKHYHYQEILPLFRYRCGYSKALPQTTAVSNFVDISGWWE